MGNTKSKAKSVGNIVAKVKAKGYITSETTHNFNGKNGGSSTNLKVNKVFLESQIHKVFNPIMAHPSGVQINPLQEPKTEETMIVPELEISPAKSLKQELEELDKKGDQIVNYNEQQLKLGNIQLITDDPDVKSYKSINTISEFVAMLKRLMRKDSMTSKKSSIQHMIDNPRGWNIDQMKEAFEASVLTHLFSKMVVPGNDHYFLI